LAQNLHDGRPDSESVEQMLVDFQHIYLPKLAAENAIQYDTDRETVTITQSGRRLLACLDGIERQVSKTPATRHETSDRTIP
jgi:hypothetical protein